MTMPADLPPCRITIRWDGDMAYYVAHCVCGIAIKEQLIASLALSGCADHFTEHPHRGFMFIDFQSTANELLDRD